MVTFLIQAVTGLGRLLYPTPWGRGLTNFFGGYECVSAIHNRVGVAMLLGFAVHLAYILPKVEWKAWRQSLFHPDSLVPRLQDVRHMGQTFRWFFGLGPPPAFDRWTYWEKFDYWAVFWGLPLLGVTGLLLMYPLAQPHYAGLGAQCDPLAAPGRSPAGHALHLHRPLYHRPFPPRHVPHERMHVRRERGIGERDGGKAALDRPPGRRRKTGGSHGPAPPPWFRVLYFIFGYLALAVGLYLLINIILHRSAIEWH